MSVDIRRMSKEDLDRLNEEGRRWRERANKPAQEPLPEPIRAEPLADIKPVQLNLFGEKQQ
jgi:hypothetical protein